MKRTSVQVSMLVLMSPQAWMSLRENFFLLVLGLAAMFALIAFGASLWHKKDNGRSLRTGVLVLWMVAFLVAFAMSLSSFFVGFQSGVTTGLTFGAVLGAGGTALLLLGSLVGRAGYRPGKGTDRVSGAFLTTLGGKNEDPTAGRK